MKPSSAITFDVEQFALFAVRKHRLLPMVAKEIVNESFFAAIRQSCPESRSFVVTFIRRKAENFFRKQNQSRFCNLDLQVCDSDFSDFAQDHEPLREFFALSNFPSEPTLHVVAPTPRPRFMHRSNQRKHSVQPERCIARLHCEMDLRTVA